MPGGGHEHHTLASVAVLLASAIESYGIDFRPLASQAGIDPDRYYDPDERLPYPRLQRVWELAVAATGDACFGLTYAEFIQPAALHGMGLAWAASDTLLDGVRRLIRYQHAVSTALDIELRTQADSYRLVFRSLAHETPPVAAAVDASLATFMRMCRITAGPTIRPRAATLTHPAPACRERFESSFGVAARFLAETNSLEFDRGALEARLPCGHPELARANDALVRDYLQRLDRDNLATRVRGQIIEQLPEGIPKQEQIAHRLNLSLRNLQRKLQDQGTSYKQLLDDTRKELAIQYLTASRRPIIEIGFLLGFTESANFSRAFRRWTGHSPQSYRRQMA